VVSIHIICRLYSDNFTKLCKLCKYDKININIIEHLFASCKDTADIRCTMSQSILNYICNVPSEINGFIMSVSHVCKSIAIVCFCIDSLIEWLISLLVN